ncbi:MAG: TlpA family protein disulfide reductase [Verrucomicrobiae bacterium]|nr:TlpA family protein disulfide reductase [Verrucomicrobiae bacterium]
MNIGKLLAVILITGGLILAIGCKKSSELPAKEESVSQKSEQKKGVIGMDAPPLKISQWVKGNPVNIAEGKGKKIFVVEFWATWCPPCQVTIPHLTEVQKKYSKNDVIIIGITDEDQKLVKQFVTKMGDKMDYIVAIDDNGETSKSYMDAFGIDTIPHAFIVDKAGKIVWQGNPMEGFDEAIESVVAGNFSLEKEIKKNLAKEKLMSFIEAVEKDEKSKIDQLGKEIEQLDKEVGGVLPDRKFNAEEAYKLVKFSLYVRAYTAGLKEGKSDKELEEVANNAEKFAPTNINFADMKNFFKLQKSAMDYFMALMAGGDETNVSNIAKMIGETKSKDPMLLSQIAYAMLTNEKVPQRDKPIALKLAQIAYDNGGSTNEDMVQIYARALFENGKKDDAVKFQKIAIDLCKDKDKKNEFETTLKEFQNK